MQCLTGSGVCVCVCSYDMSAGRCDSSPDSRSMPTVDLQWWLSSTDVFWKGQGNIQNVRDESVTSTDFDECNLFYQSNKSSFQYAVLSVQSASPLFDDVQFKTCTYNTVHGGV